MHGRDVYNSFGYLAAVKNAANGADYWRAEAVDARGNVTRFTLGNGVETLKGSDDLGNLLVRRKDTQAASETSGPHAATDVGASPGPALQAPSAVAGPSIGSG